MHKISAIFYRDWSKSGWQNSEYFSLSLSCSFSVAGTQSRQLHYPAKLATEVKFWILFNVLDKTLSSLISLIFL